MPPGTACCALADNMKAPRDLAEPYEELRQLRKKVEQAEKRRKALTLTLPFTRAGDFPKLATSALVPSYT